MLRIKIFHSSKINTAQVQVAPEAALASKASTFYIYIWKIQADMNDF